MGGGISLVEGGIEELLTTTIMIGRAISAVTFPGMFRIYDFHSKKAPKLKNAKQFTFFAPDSDDESDDGDYVTPIPSQYECFFKVMVGEDAIYLENPLAENESGWTPLHACCMSLSTVQAAFALIDETVRQGGHFETKTITGPGTFNRGWTPLQMACAYGAEPIVEKLVFNGADVNATNSFGVSCLLEACHRGFINVVRFLITSPPSSSSRIDLSYIPSERDAMNSPFSSAPCQSALAEAARCGFYKVVEVLLDAGAPKDLANNIGWTALHEACFYNRVETTKILLMKGASVTARTRLGALPYHLAGLAEIRNMLREMGGEEAVPSEGDVIDMIEILTELTNPMCSEHHISHHSETALNGAEVLSSRQHNSNLRIVSHKPVTPVQPSDDSADHKHFDEQQQLVPDHKQPHGRDQSSRVQEKESVTPLLHSGPILGDLPQLSPQKSPSKMHHLTADLDRALALNSYGGEGLMGKSSTSASKQPSLRADSKTKKMKQQARDEVPRDMPEQFICQLTHRPMSEPMRTVYGNVYDKTAILNWLKTQGKICPLTGAPLSEVELTPLTELGDEIRRWVLNKGLNKTVTSTRATDPIVPPADDSLYDF